MFKSLARTAGFLAYFLITLEMLFMVSPFALYYYSAYAPLLSAPSKFPAGRQCVSARRDLRDDLQEGKRR
jgi:hypothetical protein